VLGVVLNRYRQDALGGSLCNTTITHRVTAFVPSYFSLLVSCRRTCLTIAVGFNAMRMA
jgi:hypothetical protein